MSGIATPDEVLDFWFKETPREKWFSSDPAFDAGLRERFEKTWRAAKMGTLKHWAESRDGAIASIVVLDQFPRNMFRGTAEAFSTDPDALAVAKDALARGYDSDATPDERNFLIMPLMHSEYLADQEASVRLTAERLGVDHRSYGYALRHRDAIARFGRFPGRNAALGRPSTAEEKAFLAQHPEGF